MGKISLLLIHQPTTNVLWLRITWGVILEGVPMKSSQAQTLQPLKVSLSNRHRDLITFQASENTQTQNEVISTYLIPNRFLKHLKLLSQLVLGRQQWTASTVLLLWNLLSSGTSKQSCSWVFNYFLAKCYQQVRSWVLQITSPKVVMKASLRKWYLSWEPKNEEASLGWGDWEVVAGIS